MKAGIPIKTNNPNIELAALTSDIVLGEDDGLWYDTGSGKIAYEDTICVQGSTSVAGVRVTGGSHKLLFNDSEDVGCCAEICLSKPVFDIAAGASLTIVPGYWGGTASNCIGPIKSGEGKLIFGEPLFVGSSLEEKCTFDLRCGGDTPMTMPDADDRWYRRWCNYERVLTVGSGRIVIGETCWLTAADRSAWAHFDKDSGRLTLHGAFAADELEVAKDALRDEPRGIEESLSSRAALPTRLLTVDERMGSLNGRVVNTAWLSESRDEEAGRDLKTLHLTGNAILYGNCQPDRVEFDGCESLDIPQGVTLDLSLLDGIPPLAGCQVKGTLLLPEADAGLGQEMLADGRIRPVYRGVVRIGKQSFRAEAKLDFSKPDTPAEGEGYRWIAFSKTLVLTNFVCECETDCIRLPSRSVIELHGVNRITVTGYKSRTIAAGDQPRNFRGMLIVTGDGRLTLNGALRVGNNDLIIRGGGIDLNGRLKTDSVTLSGGKLTCRKKTELGQLELCGGEFMSEGQFEIGKLIMSRGQFSYESETRVITTLGTAVEYRPMNSFREFPTLTTRCKEVHGYTLRRSEYNGSYIYTTNVDDQKEYADQNDYAPSVKIVVK
ncbi:MAG: hypothetical protein IJ493_02550 [Clostridia bacterium]|nr:hypothetical protein [Clostridia bacterium]